MNKVKVRIAPSPTGFFHIGNARTALFNWLFARHHGGEFILRIEDTDLERSKKEYEEDILSSLEWLGLNWDGSVPHQTERLDLYEKYLKGLLTSGKAFWCGHSKEELENEQKEQMSRKEPPRHVCSHKKENFQFPISNFQKKEGIIRLAVDENSKRMIRFPDVIRGDIEWEERLLGDLSLAKNTRTPLYNFAVVVDDIDMEISHVIRGEDHISNTPKQLLIYEALGKEPPVFAHLPLILGPDRSKLSKRHGAKSIAECKKDYLPEALVNFMGFLGYTYSKEILSKEEMAKEFELGKVHKSAAVFNMEKLNWINSQYIRGNIPTGPTGPDVSEKVDDAIRGATGPAGPTLNQETLTTIKTRIEKFSDVDEFNYFWKKPNYDSSLLDWKDFSRDKIKNSLIETRMLIENWNRNDSNKDALRLLLDDLGKSLGDRGLVYWPLRVALTGREKSPDPVDVINGLLVVMGRENGSKEIFERIDTAINKL